MGKLVADGRNKTLCFLALLRPFHSPFPLGSVSFLIRQGGPLTPWAWGTPKSPQ